MSFNDKAKELGFVSPKGFMAFDSVGDAVKLNKEKTARMLADSNSIGYPISAFSYLSPEIVPILLSARNATKLGREVKTGVWTDDYMQFPVEEYAGDVTPYNDYQNGVTTDVNYEFPVREQLRFQTTLTFGDLEAEKASSAKIGLINAKQRASAEIIAQESNRFYLYGVQGKKIYGLLNDPNLNATISPINIAPSGQTGITTWTDKMSSQSSTFANIAYNDINALWTELCSKNGGNIDANTPMILALSNKMLPYLNAPNSFGLTAAKMIKDNFPNIEIIALPELSTSAGERVLLEVPELMGVSTVDCCYSDKYRLGRLVAKTSSYEQKAISTTWGAVVKRPSLIATMLGI